MVAFAKHQHSFSGSNSAGVPAPAQQSLAGVPAKPTPPAAGPTAAASADTLPGAGPAPADAVDLSPITVGRKSGRACWRARLSVVFAGVPALRQLREFAGLYLMAILISPYALWRGTWRITCGRPAERLVAIAHLRHDLRCGIVARRDALQQIANGKLRTDWIPLVMALARDADLSIEEELIS